MALATRCPQCGTTFKVAHDQLKLRAGMVRCGSCKQVFNGIEHLVRNHADEVIAPPALSPAPVPTPAPTHAPVVEPTQMYVPAPEATPASTPAPTPAPTLAPTLPPEPSIAPAFAASEQFKATAALEQIEHSTAMAETIALPEHELAPEPVAPSVEKLAASAETNSAPSAIASSADGVAEAVHTEFYFDPLAAGGRQEPHFDAKETAPAESPERSEPVPETVAVAQDESEAEEPEFVKQGRRAQGMRRVLRIGMVCGTILLTIGALGQGAYAFRSQLAAQFPPSKPWLEQACAQIGCKVGLPSQIKAVALESDELQVLPRTRNLYALTTLLRNHSQTVQSWPYIELSLNDGNDKAQARRVFTPREYLANPQDEARGFAANGEQPVKIYFEVKDIKASGYRVYLFYP